MKNLLILLCCLFIFNNDAFSIDRTWQGGPLRIWDNPDNWFPVGVPTANDRVLIPEAAIGGPIVNRFDTAYADVITIEHNISLTVQGTLFTRVIRSDGGIGVSGRLLASPSATFHVITLNDVNGCLMKNVGEIIGFNISIHGVAEFLNDGYLEAFINIQQNGTFKNETKGTVKDSEISGIGTLINEGNMLEIKRVAVDSFLNRNTGQIELISGMTSNAKKWVNKGQIDVNGGLVFSTVLSSNEGIINIAGPVSIRNGAIFENNLEGLINIVSSPNGSISFLDSAKLNNSGKIFLNNPSSSNQISHCGGCTLGALKNLPSGIIFGTGKAAAAPISFNGIISIGTTIDSTIGTLVLTSFSEFIYGTEHNINFEIGGYQGGGVPSGHDSLRWIGNVPLIGGTLNVKLINDFVPVEQDSFAIISGNIPVGVTFDAVNLPDLPSCLNWEVVYTTTNVYLKVVDACQATTNLSTLFTGVDTFYVHGAPGPIQINNSNVEPIIAATNCTGIETRTQTIATEFGAGRVMAFSNEGHLLDIGIDSFDNVTFFRNAFDYLNNGAGKRIGFNVGWANENNTTRLKAELEALGYTFITLSLPITTAQLDNIDIFFSGNDWRSEGSTDPAEVQALASFVNNGGGALLLGLGWSWPNDLQDYPMNQLAAPFGFEWIDGVIHEPINRQGDWPYFVNFYPIEDYVHPDFPALKALYAATDGDNWTNNTNWDTTGATCDVCDWHGVICTNGRVTNITLNNNGLAGSIPTTLSSLSKITIFDLGNNSLTGTIPSELGGLSTLTHIWLYGNQLDGAIPSELGSLFNLEFLGLSDNDHDSTIPTQLGNLTNLKLIALNGNKLSGSIPIELGSLSNLTGMYLQFNQLSGIIPTELGNLSNLIGLDLNNNALTGNIPIELGSLSNLEVLSLYRNQLDGMIPTELGNLIKLKFLSLSENQLTGNIPIELGNLSNLLEIHINNNQLSGGIPTVLGSLTNLIWLNLSVNQLTGNLPVELGNLSNLDYLILRNNQLEGCIPQSFDVFCGGDVDVSLTGNPNLDEQDSANFCNTESGKCINPCDSILANGSLEVTNINDSGIGSLRAAIAYANCKSGLDTIKVLTAGTISISNCDQELTETSCFLLMKIADSLVIQGNGIVLEPTVTGRLFANSNFLRLEDATIQGINYPFNGGIIYNGGIFEMERVLIQNNQSGQTAGAIRNFGTFRATNCTFSGNIADIGGAIYNSGHTVLKNCTFSGNIATTKGGAIFLASGENTILEMSSCIFANSQPTSRNDILNEATAGAITINQNNLVENCGGNCPTFATTSDPLLGSLKDNGGYTFTHELMAGSPAINATPIGTTPLEDQRGYVGDTERDMGAYEAAANQTECLENKYVNYDIMNGTEMYTANHTVAGDEEIMSGSEVMFMAGETIILRPGFHAKSGSTFTAMLEDCTVEGGNMRQMIEDDQWIAETALPHLVNSNSDPISLKEATQIFPNPTHASLTIQISKPVSGQINLYNSWGQRLQSLPINDNQHELDLSSYVEGVYWVEVLATDKGERVLEKVVKL